MPMTPVNFKATGSGPNAVVFDIAKDDDPTNVYLTDESGKIIKKVCEIPAGDTSHEVVDPATFAPFTKYAFRATAYNHSTGAESASTPIDHATTLQKTGSPPVAVPPPVSTPPVTVGGKPPALPAGASWPACTLSPHRAMISRPIPVYSNKVAVTNASGLVPKSNTLYLLKKGTHDMRVFIDVGNVVNVGIMAEDPSDPPLLAWQGKFSVGGGLVNVRNTATGVVVDNLEMVASTAQMGACVLVDGDDVTVRAVSVVNPGLKYGKTDPFFYFVVKVENDANGTVVERCVMPLTSRYFTWISPGSKRTDVRYNDVADCGEEHWLRCYGDDVMVYCNKGGNKPHTSIDEPYKNVCNVKEQEDISIFWNDFIDGWTLGPLPGGDGDPGDPTHFLHRVRLFQNIMRQRGTNGLLTLCAGVKGATVEGNVLVSQGGSLIKIDAPANYISARGKPEVTFKTNLVFGRTEQLQSLLSGDKSHGEISELVFTGNQSRK